MEVSHDALATCQLEVGVGATQRRKFAPYGKEVGNEGLQKVSLMRNNVSKERSK